VIEIEYTSYFVRKFKKLDARLQDDIVEKIELFRDSQNHAALKVHKLTGRTKEQWAFSVNYSDRVVFHWSKDKQTAYLLDVGDHSIYI